MIIIMMNIAQLMAHTKMISSQWNKIIGKMTNKNIRFSMRMRDIQMNEIRKKEKKIIIIERTLDKSFRKIGKKKFDCFLKIIVHNK